VADDRVDLCPMGGLVYEETPGGTAGAVFSADRRYRYRLWRTWGTGRRVLWILLNPSKAGAFDDDATIRKCRGFAKRWGFDGIEVVNLFALISTDPKGLLEAQDPIGGVTTDDIFRSLVERAAGERWCAMAGWRDVHRRLVWRVDLVGGILEELGRPVHIECPGLTKNRNPKHRSRPGYATPVEMFLRGWSP